MRASNGCRTAKVKVAEPGQSESDDLARLEAVRDALGAGGHVRIDVNGLWDVDTAVTRLPRYDRAAGGLEYVEQPCATVEELAAVRRRTTVPIAADESIRRAEDPMRVVALEAADIAVLKVQPLGGVRACLRIAEQIGLPVVVSSALESSVGIAAGVALAAALPELPYACGLATVQLLAARPRRRPAAADRRLAARTSSRSVARSSGRRGGRPRDARALVRQDRGRAGTRVNPSTALATVLVDELIRCGVREAVLAPGSRSAPLAFALHAADADGRLRLHVRVDERSAGLPRPGTGQGVARDVRACGHHVRHRRRQPPSGRRSRPRSRASPCSS